MSAPKIISVLMRSAAVRGDRPMNSGKFVRYDPGEEQQPHPAVMVPFADSMRTLSIKALQAQRRGRLSCLRFVMRQSASQGHDAPRNDKAGQLKDDARFRTSQIGRLHSAVALVVRYRSISGSAGKVCCCHSSREASSG